MEQRKKRFVPVVVRFDTEGNLRPLVIEFDEAHRYPCGSGPGCPTGCLSAGWRRRGSVHLPHSGKGNISLAGERCMVCRVKSLTKSLLLTDCITAVL